MVKKVCRDCKKEFEVKNTYNTRYPKKYCDKCSAQRKKDYENIHLITADDCEDDDD